MGLAASQARMMSYIAQRHDLELEEQFIVNHRMGMANQTTSLFSFHAKLDPESPAAKVLDAKIKHMQEIDKLLEMHLMRIRNRREAMVKEIEGLQKVISDDIQFSFGTMAK